MYGAFVRSVRESRNLSQAELAEVSGIPQPNISAIERDRRLPSADTLNRLLTSCGYELTATVGERVVRCPLPLAGWFPDEDLPPALDDDPDDEPTTLGAETSLEERLRVIDAVFELVDAQVASG